MAKCGLGWVLNTGYLGVSWAAWELERLDMTCAWYDELHGWSKDGLIKGWADCGLGWLWAELNLAKTGWSVYFCVLAGLNFVWIWLWLGWVGIGRNNTGCTEMDYYGLGLVARGMGESWTILSLGWADCRLGPVYCSAECGLGWVWAWLSVVRLSRRLVRVWVGPREQKLLNFHTALHSIALFIWKYISYVYVVPAGSRFSQKLTLVNLTNLILLIIFLWITYHSWIFKNLANYHRTFLTWWTYNCFSHLRWGEGVRYRSVCIQCWGAAWGMKIFGLDITYSGPWHGQNYFLTIRTRHNIRDYSV
jgi:hypothetical protein